jgi:hypothetical protein
MQPVLYQLNGSLPADKYLPGQYQWPFATQITTALLDCQPPAGGVLALILEVGGVLKAFRFTVAAGTTALVIPQNVNVLVPANTVVRWKAAFSEAPEAAAVDVALTMQVVPQSISQVTAVPPKLTVQWSNGIERLTLFNYNPTTHTFSEATPGISAGRATVTQSAPQTSVFIGATEVLRVAGSKLFSPSFFALGSTVSKYSPTLTFQVDTLPVARLDLGGFRVVDLTEGTPAALSPTDAGFNSRFEFWSGGVLTAALNANGVVALEVDEL